MRLVFKVDADDIRQVLVARGDKRQIVEPLLFGVIVRIPQLGQIVAVRRVVVEQNVNLLVVQFIDDQIEKLERFFALQLAIPRKINRSGVRDRNVLQNSRAERQANGVKAGVFDLFYLAAPIARPESVDDIVVDFLKAKPVDAAQLNLLIAAAVIDTS